MEQKLVLKKCFLYGCLFYCYNKIGKSGLSLLPHERTKTY